MMPAKPRVFISYSHEDAAFVDRLIEALRRATNEAFVFVRDTETVKPGESLTAQISRAVFSSQAIVIVLPSEGEHRWMKAEVSFALAKAQTNKSFKIIPVATHSQSVMPHLLRDYVYLDFTDEAQFERHISKLVDALTLDKLPADFRQARNAQRLLVRDQKRTFARDSHSFQAENARALQSTILVTAAATLVAVFPLLKALSLPLSDSLFIILPAMTAVLGYLAGKINTQRRDNLARHQTRRSRTR